MLMLPSPAVLDVSQSLLLVLVHSLWQAAIVALTVSALLRLIPARKTDLRYTIAAGSLLFVVMMALTTWSVMRLESPAGATQATVASVSAPPLGNASASSTVSQTSETPGEFSVQSLRMLAPWLVGLWVVGAVVLLLRAFRGLAEVKLLLRETATTEAEISVLSLLRSEVGQLCHALGMRQSVTLQRCSNLASPAVVGIFWPVILVPASMLAGNTLSKEQWQIVLAHELAHVRRLDGLINLAQLLIESALFFNPCVWWISRQIRVEREACCDALAARVTGRPLSVARTLLSVAETINRSSETAGSKKGRVPVPALAFADSGEPGSLRDRVNRLAEPDRAPRSRMSWIGLTWLGLICSVAMLIGAAFALQQGTDVAVRSAAAMLSPQERIDELARLQAENTGVYAPRSDGETSVDDPADVQEGKVNVHIVVRTEDGSPIPKGVSVVAGLRRHLHSAALTLAHKNDSVPSLEFDEEFDSGILRIAASAEGFAPSFSPEVTLRPDAEPPTVELILTKGFSQDLRVEDENGQPVSSIEIDVWGRLKSGSMMMGLNHARSKPIAADGEVHLDNLSADAVYAITVRSPGWEFQETLQQFSENEPAVLLVRRAQPTSLHVVDGETGEPVEGAAIQVAGWNDLQDVGPPLPRMGDPREIHLTDSSWVFGTTGGDGKARVDMLNRDMKYLLAIRAEGYQPELVHPVRAGVSPDPIRLSRAIVFEGQIVGDLDQLPSRRHNGKRVRQLKYRNDLRVSDSVYSGLLDVDVDEEGRFRIDDLIPGGMKFSLQSGMVSMPSDKSRSDIVLNLDEIAAANDPGNLTPLETRPVVVRLQGLKEDAILRGEVQFQWRERDQWVRRSASVADRTATMEIPVGASFSVREKGLVGCVFDESVRNVVVAGEGAQSVDIEAQAAGGVYGTVRRADGRPATDSYVAVVEITDPPSGRLDPNPSIATNSHAFFRTVPLGGTYAVLAREFNDDHTVWAISETFRIDEDNPIQELTLVLGEGELTSVRVLDDSGKPVIGAAVSFSISHSANGSSRSQAIGGLTNEDGIANLGLVQLQGNSGDTDVSISAKITPTQGLTGWRDTLDNSRNDFTIRLDKAVTASGIVIDAATDLPIPNAEVVVYPVDFNTARYVGHIRTTTDDDGRFEFDGLEPIRYLVTVQQTVPLGTVIIPQPGGGHRYEYPNGPTEQILTGGSDRLHMYQVQIVPGSNLKPSE